MIKMHNLFYFVLFTVVATSYDLNRKETTESIIILSNEEHEKVSIQIGKKLSLILTHSYNIQLKVE